MKDIRKIDPVEEMAINLISPKNKGVIESESLDESYVRMLPASIVKMIFTWLESNHRLDETDLKMAVMTFIGCGGEKGKELEIHFSDLKGCNPVYSFRRFKLSTKKSLLIKDSHKWHEVYLVELDEDQNISNEINNLSPEVLNYLLRNIIPHEVEKSHKAFRNFNKDLGKIPVGTKLPLKEIVISVDNADLEEAFLTCEMMMGKDIPRPSYLQLVSEKHSLFNK